MAVRQLSRREHEVLVLIGKGRSNQEIAETLDITYQSVKNLITHLMLKYGMRNRTELALLNFPCMTKAGEQREEEHMCRFTGQPCGGSRRDCRFWSEKFETCLLVEIVETVMASHS